MEEILRDELIKKLDEYIKELKTNPDAETTLHESDIADILTEIKKVDKDRFFEYLKALPPEIIGDAFLELPDRFQDDLSREMSADDLAKIINELDTDDATDIVLKIEENDASKAKEVIEQLEDEHKEHIKSLKLYGDDKAGSIMQVELFKVNIDEIISKALIRLKKLKKEEELENIHYAFVVDNHNKLIGMISLEDLIIADFNQRFKDIEEEFEEPISVKSHDDIQDVLNLVEKYNLTVVPVVDEFNHLLGRITSDDMYDIIEESATEQIYSLANVNTQEELEDSVIETGKSRGYWLFINLITAVIASTVVGLFEDTIATIVALAVLMPIIASMGGIAGTQTMTVVVRQLALGEVTFANTREVLKKEVLVALFNGVIFSSIVALFAYFKFGMPLLGLVMALAIFVNLMLAGFFGAMIPLFLKKLDIDPAIASGVLLTTVTDVMGFCVFLGLATIFLR
ncbi:MAG: magnesium transporter [Campylobacterota bacterium]|nr:magnesium transporter [Campylobacterota bacterium]